MNKLYVAMALGFAYLLLPGSLEAQSTASFRILFGVTDSTPTRWDGTVSVQEAGKFELQPWRFEGADGISGPLFHITTHPARLFSGSTPSSGVAIVANGFLLNITGMTENTAIAITTAQGDFRFKPADVKYGAGLYKLGGRVYIDPVPASTRVSHSAGENDYPATASEPNGDIWLVYVEFHHSADYLKLRVSPKPTPTDFSVYKEPTGGDQIFARKYTRGVWGEPIPITEKGGDLYRPAVAVDGRGRAWVFWSENVDGNFDVFARAIDGSEPKERIRISSEPGSDIDPVAVRNSQGNIVVAWQGWRDGKAAIFAAEQRGDQFSSLGKISNSNANEWNPAIAADKSGRVSVAWDSYRNANYDIYVRTFSNGSWGKEIPVAATARYEAYPSIAYDGTGRLWIAYEEGGKGWGKDFGAYSTPGIALYQGRLIRLRGLESNGRLVDLDANLDQALVGVPNLFADHLGSQAESETLDPNPQNALQRRPDQPAANNLRAAKNTLPRLTIDDSGRVWLAFRSAHPIWWSPLGTVWTEYAVSYDGKSWTRPVFLNHSDNLLDNRPALTVIADGKLLIVNSSDNRRDFQIGESVSGAGGLGDKVPTDPYRNDLWSHELDLGPANQALPAVAAKVQNDPPTVDRTDAAAVAKLHSYRGGPDGNLHVIRGEFHRHSEISMDGGSDGTILDQWRYALDAAALDWVGCCDHDNGGGREYSWWITQKLTDIFNAPNKFTNMFAYERSVPYPEGHRNVIFAERGIRPLPRLPLSGENEPGHAPDTQMLYAYLKQFKGVTASHTSATSMGTDWRDNDPESEPVVEIYQGDRQNYEIAEGPRSNNEKDSIGGWRPKGFVNVALDRGFRLAFESSSDHVSTHISYCNLYVKENTRESVLDAFQKRHVYAATDNILADVESGPYLMGDEFSTAELPSLKVKLSGTSRFAKVVIVKDGKYVYSTAPNTQDVEFSWRDNQPTKDTTAYYYVRGEQDNGEIVWASPLWIKYTGR
jgi:hypothetical protein